ncbi:MAG: helix-turn-helix transcriptional regulator [Bacteriovorax sp.]|nr:helix-turn-helix transcriptional regulator [Bacteriovorax sp.]
MTTKIKYGLKELERDYGIMTFGRMLKNFREVDEYTQKDFAKLLGISPQRLNDFEKERRLPDIASAASFAKKLKDSESFFVQMLLQDYMRMAKLKLEVSVTEKAA